MPPSVKKNIARGIIFIVDFFRRVAPRRYSAQALAQAAQARWGNESQALQNWLLQMEQWRYAPHGSRHLTLAALRRGYRDLTWPHARTP